MPGTLMNKVLSCSTAQTASEQTCADNSCAWLSAAQHILRQHFTARHNTAQRSAAQLSYYAGQHSKAILFAPEQHGTAQYRTALYTRAQHSTALHSIAQHSTAQHSTACKLHRPDAEGGGRLPGEHESKQRGDDGAHENVQQPSIEELHRAVVARRGIVLRNKGELSTTLLGTCALPV